MADTGLIATIVRRPVTTIMVTIALVLFGVVAATRLPVELLPNLSYPSITVRSEFGDAAPAEVEELVTRPIEERIGAVPGVVAINSVSREGLSEVVLDFAWGTSIDGALAEVREKLDRVRLPETVAPPAVLRYDPSREAIVRVALTATVEGEHRPSNSAAELRYLAEHSLERSLEKVAGVAAVEVHGGDREEVRVELDPARLAALAVDPQQVVDAIRADHVNIPSGAVTDGGQRYLIRTLHEARKADDLAGIIVRSQEGARLRLGDIAKIHRAPKEADEFALVDGQAAVELSIYREGDANTVAVSERIRKELASLGRKLPQGLRLVPLSDRATFIEAAIEEVLLNTVIGALMAVIVLLVFLRDLRATLVIGLAIPVSLAATFVPLASLGISLNMMSLGGLALGVGMLVDNSIVTLESIARLRDTHPEWSSVRCAVVGTQEIAASVFAATLTTVAVFFPMAFVDGIAGQLVHDLSRAISFGILSSMFVSLSVVPVLQAVSGRGDTEAAASSPAETNEDARASWVSWLIVVPALAWKGIQRLTKVAGGAGGPVRALVSGVSTVSTSSYSAVLRVCLRLRWLVVLVTALLCWKGYRDAESLGRTLIPEVHQGEFFVQITLPRGTSIQRTHQLTRNLSRRLAQDTRVETNFARVGSVSRAASAAGNLEGHHLAEINIRLRAPESSEAPDAARAESPWLDFLNKVGLQLRAMTFSQSELESRDVYFERQQRGVEQIVLEGLGLGIDLGPQDERVQVEFGQPQLLSFAPPIEINVYAENLTLGAQRLEQLVPAVSALEGVGELHHDELGGRPELRVHFDRRALDQVGLSVAQAASALARAIDGEVVGTIQDPQQALDIRVQLPNHARRQRDDLQRIQVGSFENQPIFAGTIAEIELGSGPAQIRRIDGRRGLSIRANATTTDLERVAGELREVIASIAEREDGELRSAKDRVQVELAGQIEEMGDSLLSLTFVGLLALFLVYVVMASSFESLMHPLLIMATVPIAGVGVVWACQVAEIPVSIMVGIGGIILGGIVVNNAIVLTNAINAHRGRSPASGESKAQLEEAIVSASRTRLRPIVMTSLTTILGLLPMALAAGEGAALRQPLAISVIGGLGLSGVLTLIVIPCVYRILPGRIRTAWRN